MKEVALSVPGYTNITGPEEINKIPVDIYGGNIIILGIQLFLFAAILIALFMLIWGGIKWMTSGGSKQEVDLAKKTLVFAIIGLVITFLSFALINLIGGFFDVPIGVK
ncbi:MAG: hypothetical protein HYY87_00525 [Candidatus Levybacteria bacterium]|nr:hypothetical protein [Candidatus Levybacteria bacterium]